MLWQRAKLFFRDTRIVLCNSSSHLGKYFPITNHQIQHSYLIHFHHLCYLHVIEKRGKGSVQLVLSDFGHGLGCHKNQGSHVAASHTSWFQLGLYVIFFNGLGL